ncbi:MAG: energy transducer TonB [Terracidiphilus sp.]|nr:energy transducer TonB [Candidatus Sulfotelmatobacter sp.]
MTYILERVPAKLAAMHRRVIIPLLLTASLALAQVTSDRQESKPVRLSPSTFENLKVDAKLLRGGNGVVVHATITKAGRVTGIEFVTGNADLMPEVRKALANWRYRPCVYEGHRVAVETKIEVTFDPLTGG